MLVLLWSAPLRPVSTHLLNACTIPYILMDDIQRRLYKIPGHTPSCLAASLLAIAASSSTPLHKLQSYVSDDQGPHFALPNFGFDAYLVLGALFLRLLHFGCLTLVVCTLSSSPTTGNRRRHAVRDHLVANSTVTESKPTVPLHSAISVAPLVRAA